MSQEEGEWIELLFHISINVRLIANAQAINQC